MDTEGFSTYNTFKHLLKVKNQAQSTLVKLDQLEKEFSKDNFTEKLQDVKALVRSLRIRVLQAFDAITQDLMEKIK